MRRRAALLPVLGLAVLLAPAVAQAHTARLVATPAPSARPAAGLLLALAAATLAVLPRRLRRAVGLGLVVLLALFAFETGLHSVHHLGERPPVPCAVASASAHVSGVTTTVVEVVAPAPAVEQAAARAPVWPVALPPIRVHEGRAPPSSPLA